MKVLLILVLSLLSQVSYGQFYLTLSEKIVKSDFTVFQPMEERGYPAMDNGFVKIRLGGKYYFKDLAAFGHFEYSIGEGQGITKKRRGTSNGYGFNVGGQYGFVTWKEFRIFTAMEMGIHKYQLKYQYQDITLGQYGYIDAFLFDGIGFHEDLSLGMEKKFMFSRSEFGFGLSLGYRFDQRNWNLRNNIKITNSQAFHNGLFGSIEFSYRPNKK